MGEAGNLLVLFNYLWKKGKELEKGREIKEYSFGDILRWQDFLEKKLEDFEMWVT